MSPIVEPIPIGLDGKPAYVRLPKRGAGFNTDFTQKRFRVGKGFLRQGYLLGTNARPQDINRSRQELLGWRSELSFQNRVMPLPRSIASPGLGVLDDFEDGSIADYTPSSPYWSASTAAKHEGNYGLRFASDTTPSRIYRTDLTLTQGNTYTCWTRCSQGAAGDIDSACLIFGLQDCDHYYMAGFSYVLQELALLKVSPSWLELGTVAATVVANTWYQLTLGWAVGGAMTLNWSGGAQQATGADNTWASGGFGFLIELEYENSVTVDWDYFVEV